VAAAVRRGAARGSGRGAWVSGSVEETERLGGLLAASLEAGDVIALSGPLGAGKTRFIAGVARALGGRGVVRSPTFTLVNEYRGRLPLVHADLYRVDSHEVEGLGLDEHRERGVLAVEWGEKLPAALLEAALGLEFEIRSAEERAILARTAAGSAADSRPQALLRAWRAAVAAMSGRGG